MARSKRVKRALSRVNFNEAHYFAMCKLKIDRNLRVKYRKLTIPVERHPNSFRKSTECRSLCLVTESVTIRNNKGDKMHPCLLLVLSPNGSVIPFHMDHSAY